jgi:cystathionine beta-lyase/cystathionine gamma-synthase
MPENHMRFSTRAIHAGQPPEAVTGAVNVPIFLSTTFAQASPGKSKGFVYGRTGNPTRAVLERTIAELEGGKAGLAFSSGLGALVTLVESFGSHQRIVAIDDVYGGTWRLLDHHHRKFGVDVEFVDMTRIDSIRGALARARTDLVYLESPTNPLLRVVDIRAISRLSHAAGARVAVDNTFATPALQRPLELGADIVLHSTTKYLGGHSDVLGGALAFRDPRLARRFAWLQNTVGAVPSPFDSFLILRGIHTLGIRMRAHEASARAVAEVLERSSKVRATYYPGLASHPQYPIARRQMSGFGGMVSFELANAGAAGRFARALRIFTLAESLGGVESLADHPASMTHASVPPEIRRARGVRDGLIRLSCGIEDPADLADDVGRALRRV